MSDFLKKLKEYQKSHKEKCKELIKEGVQIVFDNNPDVNFFVVVGFTPYFADGDICEHGQHIEERYDDDYYDGYTLEAGDLHTPSGEVLQTEPLVESWRDEKKAENGSNIIHALQDEFQLVHGTGWKILFVRDSAESDGFVMKEIEFHDHD